MGFRGSRVQIPPSRLLTRWRCYFPRPGCYFRLLASRFAQHGRERACAASYIDAGAHSPGISCTIVLAAGVLSVYWIVEGHGYEVTGLDVLDVFSHIMRAAETSGTKAETNERLRSLVAHDAPDGVVRRVLGSVLTTDE